MVKLRVNTDNFVGAADKIRKLIKDKALPAIATEKIAMVKEKTGQGIDYQDQAFKEYNERYFYDVRVGKYGLWGTPNLYITGGLLGDMQQIVDGDKVIITFGDVYGPIAKGNQDRWGRMFLNYDPTDNARLRSAAVTAMYSFKEYLHA